MMLLLFLLGVFLICMAMLWTEGFWGNVITFCNALIAGILATGLYEPVANMLDNQFPSFTFLWDFISVWLVFAIAYSILRGVTDFLSKWRVRFNPPVEMGGNMAFAVAVGLLMTCFTSFTLHMAPLAREPFGDVSMTPPFNLATYPSVVWLEGVSLVSRGSLSTMRPNPFDPRQEFIQYYANRRAQLETLDGFRVER